MSSVWFFRAFGESGRFSRGEVSPTKDAREKRRLWVILSYYSQPSPTLNLLPGFNLLRLEHEEIDTDQHHLTVNVSSTQTLAQCALCAHPTTRIHSRYERTLLELPCVNYSLTLVMQVCKFFCDNSDCIRRVFAERIPEVTKPWARKTETLGQKLSKSTDCLASRPESGDIDRLVNSTSWSRNTFTRSIEDLQKWHCCSGCWWLSTITLAVGVGDWPHWTTTSCKLLRFNSQSLPHQRLMIWAANSLLI